jgi:gamma-glutamyl hercynylcysteine S-oxide synthase
VTQIMEHNLLQPSAFAENTSGPAQSPTDWRSANAAQLAAGLRDVRSRSLAIFDAYAAAGALNVAYNEELNPPLWELGHIGWFQELWIGRNPQRDAGIAYDHTRARAPCLLTHGDAWYDSGQVAHAARWHLPLLAPGECKAYLAASLEQTLALLKTADHSDNALYFYRLVLVHEAMHLEAAVYMAQALGVAVDAAIYAPQDTTNSIAARASFTWATGQLSIQKQVWTLGSSATGFVFDNELGAHAVALDSYQIDAHPISWAQYLHYVDKTNCALPRYMRQAASGYEQQVFGQWQPVNLDQAAVHLSYFEAQAYCHWAGRRLPTEAQWECAAMTQPNFAWGEVWEWTASTFAPYPGFAAHPYLDYSQPWFNSRPVLRGACAATQPMLHSAKYRNYFMPQRTDIYAGFRTCGFNF